MMENKKFRFTIISFVLVFLFASCNKNKNTYNEAQINIENTDSIIRSDGIERINLFDSTMSVAYDEYSNIKYVPDLYFRAFSMGYLRIRSTNGVFYIFNLKNDYIKTISKGKRKWLGCVNVNQINIVDSDSLFQNIKSENEIYGLCYIKAKKSYLGRSKIDIYPIYVFTLDYFLKNSETVHRNILKSVNENSNVILSEVYLDEEIDSEIDE